jgi:hypothetical protein
VLLLVVAVLAGVAVAARSHGVAPPGGPPATPGAAVSAPGAESSAWYCTGQSTAAGQLAPGALILTNAGSRPVSGTIDGVTDTGAKVEAAVVVPARGQVIANVPAPASGTWISEAVVLSGGGVAVTQALKGASGWAEAPCQSSTAQQWYFPSGVTAVSDALFIALFNPTSTPDVVDLSFVTPQGTVHPINFQGIVLQPDRMQVESISPYVQNQPYVATTVTTRTGRVVASELQLLVGGRAGLAIVPGSPGPEREWTIPQSQEVAAGYARLDVFNPGPTTEVVTVRTRLASGPLAPFVARVPPGTVWVLRTSEETRIPKGDPYSTIIDARGGSGVVVGRIVVGPATAPAPQGGLANAVDRLSATSPTGRWVVPSLGSLTAPALAGAAPDDLALTNLRGERERYQVAVITPAGVRTLTSGDVAPAATVSLSQRVLARAGLNPMLVSASGPAAVSEDVGPTGSYGAVTMPGLPLSSPSG